MTGDAAYWDTPEGTGQAAELELGGLPPSWEERAARYAQLLAELARARQEETQTYGSAFLGASGPVESRTQVAKVTASGQRYAVELAAAKVAAYQVMLKAELGESDLNGNA